MALNSGDHPVKLNLGVLPNLLSRIINVDHAKVVLCSSIPVNVAIEDVPSVNKRRAFFGVLERTYGYTVELYDINFHGKRLLKRDRDPNDTWAPHEKCVDIALAANILFYAPTYDIGIVVTGDRDFLPAVQKAQKLGKRMIIASLKASCSNILQIIEHLWIDDLLPDLYLPGSQSN